MIVASLATASPAQAGKATFGYYCDASNVIFTGVPGGTKTVRVFVNYDFVDTISKPFTWNGSGYYGELYIYGVAYDGRGKFKGYSTEGTCTF
jgi:hypothetical protein